MCATPEAAAADELTGRLSSLSLNASDELGVAARALQAMAEHAREHGLKLALSAVQICFELATDLLDPAAAVGALRGSGEPDPSSLCGASRHQVAEPAAGLALLRRAQEARVRTAEEPGSAH